jgi:hypothetical protein
MTEKKNTITRADAVANAIEWIKDAAGDDAEMLATVDVLTKMHAQLTKPRAKAVTKARKVNENLAEKVCECFPIDGSTVTTKDVVNMGFPEITTTQKAAAVLRVACELGLASKVVDGKKVAYKAADAEAAE